MNRLDILTSRTGWVVLLAASLVGGCGRHTPIDFGTGGTTGGGGTPTTGSGGAKTSPGTGGAASATGGASGTAGSSGSSCGPKCSAASTCDPSVIASGLTTLTDFSSNLDAGNIFHTGGVDDWTSLYGGTWVGPVASDPCATTPAPYPLAQNFTGGNWHITGTIASNHWAGAGLWFGTSCPVMDLSAYQGISFTVAGNAGPSGSISVTVSSASNSAPNTDATSSNFTCYSNAATCTTSTCTAASLTVSNITTTPQTVRVLWDNLKNGAPVATPGRNEITAFGINPTLDWSGTASPYSLDLIIDDLAFIP